jgi:hypothetical protein
MVRASSARSRALRHLGRLGAGQLNAHLARAVLQPGDLVLEPGPLLPPWMPSIRLLPPSSKLRNSDARRREQRRGQIDDVPRRA